MKGKIEEEASSLQHYSNLK